MLFTEQLTLPLGRLRYHTDLWRSEAILCSRSEERKDVQECLLLHINIQHQLLILLFYTN